MNSSDGSTPDWRAFRRVMAETAYSQKPWGWTSRRSLTGVANSWLAKSSQDAFAGQEAEDRGPKKNAHPLEPAWPTAPRQHRWRSRGASEQTLDGQAAQSTQQRAAPIQYPGQP